MRYFILFSYGVIFIQVPPWPVAASTVVLGSAARELSSCCARQPSLPCTQERCRGLWAASPS